jgi:hypothetical protein
MSDGPVATAKKIKAFAIADEYLALLERTYNNDRDECMALAIMTLKFIVKYQANPEAFLRWHNKTVRTGLRTAMERQAAQRARPQ